jgi:hypothetical protein
LAWFFSSFFFFFFFTSKLSVFVTTFSFAPAQHSVCNRFMFLVYGVDTHLHGMAWWEEMVALRWRWRCCLMDAEAVWLQGLADGVGEGENGNADRLNVWLMSLILDGNQ